MSMSLVSLMMAAMLGSATASDCDARLCNPAPLAPVAASISAGQPVHIMMIGDSHTAGDAVSDGWRQQLDAAFGSAGRGVVAGGRPYRGYLTWGINALWSDGWQVNGIFGSVWQEGGQPVGLSGYSKTTYSAGQYLSLDSEDYKYLFDRFVLCGVARPGGGSVLVTIGAQSETVSFDAPVTRPLCREFNTASLTGSVIVTTQEDRPVTITSMGTFRRNRGGVTLTNLGVPGSQLSHFGRANESMIIAEMQAYDPDLIVLAYGTNEGFNPRFDHIQYETELRRRIRALQQTTVNNVPILLIGPPFAMTRDNSIAFAGDTPPAQCETGLMVPGHLREVSAVQRRVAQEMGLIFWDWAMAMGGACAMYDWRASGLAARDAVHFTREGGARLGAILGEDFRTALQVAPFAASISSPPAGGSVQITQ